MILIFNSWLFYVIIYLIFAVAFNQAYKFIVKSMKKAGSLTVLVEGLAGLICLLMVPFFELKFPKDYRVYLFLALAIIFYALNDRISTTARSGIEASTYSIIKQLSTVFMIFAGLIFFKEPFIWNKILGAVLIIGSNFLVFYKKGNFKLDKYVGLGIIANICLTIALFIDVNYSKEFNLPMYVSITLIFPALLIFLVERIKIKDIVLEYKNCNKMFLLVTSISWAIMMISKLMAYNLGKVTVIAPLCSLTVILNVVVGYFAFKERENLLKKIVAAILIILGIILIKF